MTSNCENCGASLGLEDEICPYCDSVNPFFQQHREDMEHYQEKFEETQEEVVRHSKRYVRTAIQVATASVLIVLNLILAYTQSQMREIQYWVEEQEALSAYEEHKAVLDMLQEEKQYVGFESYVSQHGLEFVREFQEYDSFLRATELYSTIYRTIILLRYDEELLESSYDTWIEFTAEALLDLHQVMIPDDYDDPEEFTPVHVQAMEDVLTQAKALLKGYTDIPHSTIDNIHELSKLDLMILLKEALPYAKT